jgi:hypothetical protein
LGAEGGEEVGAAGLDHRPPSFLVGVVGAQAVPMRHTAAAARTPVAEAAVPVKGSAAASDATAAAVRVAVQ